MATNDECATFVRMKHWQDFFSMTRRERQGVIVLLVLIALLLGVTWGLKYCRNQEEVPTQSVEIEKFESEIDSVATPDDKPASAPKHRSSQKKRKPHAPKPSKPAPAPRPVDPVPQF